MSRIPALGTGRGAVKRSADTVIGLLRLRTVQVYGGRFLHVELLGRSPDDAGQLTWGARQTFVLRLEEAGQREQLQSASLGDQFGGDAVLSQGVHDDGGAFGRVGDPEGLVAAGRLDLDLGDGERRLRAP